MNNRLISISNRSLHVGVLVILALLVFYVIYHREFIYEWIFSAISISILKENTLTVLSCATIIFSIIFFHEFKTSVSFQNSSTSDLKYYMSQLDGLYAKLPAKVKETYVFRNLKNHCYQLWYEGRLDEFNNCVSLQKDVLEYIVKLEYSDVVVTWKEERIYVNKLLELVGLCFDTNNFKIELFDSNANYRFPTGLFIVPLFNAIDIAVQHKSSLLRVECFNVDNLWNCQIANYLLPSERSNLGYKFRGANYIKSRINRGNWPIRFNKMCVDQGLIVVMVGKYMN